MRTLAIVLGLVLVAAPSFAGLNPTGELAMHVVTNSAYLDCPELATPGSGFFPLDCTGIDNSATPEELAASFGYAYVVFCCYNVTGITGVEYAVTGYPAGRSNPALYYCPAASLVLGDPFVGGGIQTLGGCFEPDPLAPCGGMVGFAWTVFGATLTANTSVMSYVPSTYSNAADPHNYFLDCSVDFVVDNTVSEHGCTINGTHTEMVPYADCDPGATAVEPSTWSNVKSMYR